MSLIGSRLSAVTRLLSDVKDNTLFADIGSDHAFLAIEVLKKGLAVSAIASDINEQPLLKGKENAARSGVKIDFYLSDGFDAIDSLPITSAAICGMGGELIAKIIGRSRVAHEATLIVQPMSAQEDLRKYLWDNGFVIEKEIFTLEANKSYTVMKLRFSGERTEYSYIDLFLGKEREQTKEFSLYCEKILTAAKKRRLGVVARNEDTAEIDGLIDFCQTQTTTL
ncbi:MAG: SAM-dependent methyltransferase [Clostridia bacterium]|nr:SAM-dependent methyltransferase [Clostridia bacterium]